MSAEIIDFTTRKRIDDGVKEEEERKAREDLVKAYQNLMHDVVGQLANDGLLIEQGLLIVPKDMDMSDCCVAFANPNMTLKEFHALVLGCLNKFREQHGFAPIRAHFRKMEIDDGPEEPIA